MNGLTAIAAALSLVAVLFFGRSIGQLRRGRMLRASGSIVAGSVTAVIGTAGILLAISYLGYQRLTDEQSVGVIEFSPTAPQEYIARLMIDGQLDRLLTLRGEEWQLDARIVTWKPPATLPGLEPVYQLERLSGRYTSVQRELTESRTVHALAEERPLDLWSLARRFPRFAPGVDAYYGTAPYLPMADGARFHITLSRDALVARPVNDAAREALGDWRGEPG